MVLENNATQREATDNGQTETTEEEAEIKRAKATEEKHTGKEKGQVAWVFLW